MSDRRRCRRPAPSSGGADDDIVTHNTLSADVTHVEVFYPFHPLHGYRLRVLRRLKKNEGAVAVVDPKGQRLKIPTWMLLPTASKAETGARATVNRESLLSLVTLLQSIHNKNRENLLATSADASKGDRNAATATAKPGSNKRGTRSRRSGG